MDDTTPATKSDLQKLEQRLEQSMDRRFTRIHEDIDRVLSILVKVKNKTDDHEQRIGILEEAVV
ncbi:hypothetical protein A3C37_03765 [Candidatus Peribacteria bacterium RIFCSPHIGHO2_02_FULL_53_20]|nr:MAG: hypothetical protein A3C37_03765 [Candidatus Peribacteria bacterium RIFCSPHIGHO2_02_FULL_53_20]OGJ68033.1 MAG: hypothetical protein A3B61_00330 [Candidatus Peribacteria bacterium RIFCSPLOWO2_01_FULL_53_10]OGJ73146.1 MAG: hypothetical protein A3G69_05850 [Candidatus Peribacteria bacterium RIFCSPLOWO2_12_FULL_53_10]